MKNKSIFQQLERKAYAHFSDKPLFINLDLFIHQHGGVMLFVGGMIRSIATNQSIYDYDVEVYFLSEDKLKSVLEQFAAKIGSTLIYVGAKFGVFKIPLMNIDIAMPRTEISTGVGHTDFLVKIDPNLTYAEASLRRDFKMNAIGYSRYFRVILDPNDGIGDIINKQINIVKSKEIFLEDPLRLLRGIYFSNKLSFVLSDEIIGMLRESSYLLNYISMPRIANEFYKVMLSKNLHYLHYFLELKNCDIPFIGVLQQMLENDVARHILSDLPDIRSRIFFILLHHFNNVVIEFLQTMPNHKEYNFSLVVYIAEIYNRVCLDKQDKYTKRNVFRKIHSEATYNELKKVILELNKITYFQKYTHKITKSIFLYLFNLKEYGRKARFKHK